MMILILESPQTTVTPRCSVQLSPGKRGSVWSSVNWMEWWTRVSRPPPPRPPGRSRRTDVYPGKPRKVEAWESLVSWIHATFMLRLNRRVESSVYPDMMPFALNCRKAGGGVVCGGAVGGWGEGEGEG